MTAEIVKKPGKRLVPIAAFIIVLPILIALGFWQLDRADQKRQLQALYDARMSDAPVAIGGELVAPGDLQFRQVTFEGVYEPGHTILLDNRVHAGQVGYYVLTPVRLRGSDVRVLVNRGWVAQGRSRDQLPVIDTPATRVRITGIGTTPHKKVFRLAPPPPLTLQWQTLWQHINLARFSEATGHTLQPTVVLLNPDSEAGGFVREWKRLDTGIAVHQGYAFQWFSLAVALAAIFVFLTWGRRAPAEDSDNELTG